LSRNGESARALQSPEKNADMQAQARTHRADLPGVDFHGDRNYTIATA